LEFPFVFRVYFKSFVDDFIKSLYFCIKHHPFTFLFDEDFMIVKPLVRSNICLNAHPKGCAKDVENQIEYILQKKKSRAFTEKPKTVVILGASTGYGLASRITAAFGYDALTIGVSFEREGGLKKSASPGWYNNLAFDACAKKMNLESYTFNIDAFSEEACDTMIEKLKSLNKKADLVIYSIASPVRTDPESGVFYKSVLKPIQQNFEGNTIDILSSKFSPVKVEPATEEEIQNTVKVMGGEDWERWIHKMQKASVLAPQVKTIAYSYVGPELSHAIYRNGTIGEAKKHLEATAKTLSQYLSQSVGGEAFVSINKGLVTRSSTVIPIMPFYISILYKVMKRKNTHEDCIAQCERLFAERLYTGNPIPVDENGLIRIDEFEMDPSVQEEVAQTMKEITEENLYELSDFKGFLKDFYTIHGFDVDGIDYSQALERLDQI